MNMKHFCLMIICVCLSVSSMAQNSGGMTTGIAGTGQCLAQQGGKIKN